MGLFSKLSSTVVPENVLSQLKSYGHASWEARLSSRPIADPRFGWDSFVSKAVAAIRASPTQAVGEIHAAAGGDPIAQFGGYLLIAECEPTMLDARYLEMMDASLRMMYDKGLSSGHLNRYEADRWIAAHGDLRTSFDRIVDVVPSPPSDHAAEMTLPVGDSLMVATMGPGGLDNQFWIERTSAGTFEAFSMRRWSSEDESLTRCPEATVGSWSTLDEVLRSLGGYLRSRPFWSHDLLDPYFTERRNI